MSEPDPDDPREGVLPVRLVIAMLVVILGATALLSGFLGGSDEPAGTAVDVPASAQRAGDIAVYDAYVREPVTDTAAAYFVITNTGSEPDVLTGVSTPVAAQAELHDVGKTPPGASGAPADLGSGSMTPTPTVAIGPGETIVLEPGGGHLMLMGVSGTLAPGSTVNLHLVFERSGTLSIAATVIGLSDPPPTR